MNLSTNLLRRTFSTITIIVISFATNAQGYYNNDYVGRSILDGAINIGPSNFLGDVGGNKGKGTKFLKDLNIPVTNIFYGGHLTYFPREWIGIRAQFNMGTLSGYDSLIKNDGGVENDRKNRNLGFRSNIQEASLSIEFYPTVFFEKYDGCDGKIRPYVSFGIGVLHFNPQGQYIDGNGKASWVNLKPLHLEGQGFAEYPDRKEYSNYALQIPLAIGIKYYVSEKLFIGAEVSQRFTFTDYIDDVSKTYIDPALFAKYLPKDQVPIAQQMMFKRALVNNRSVKDFIGKERGNSKNNDYYLSLFFKVGFRILTGDSEDPHRKPLYTRYY